MGYSLHFAPDALVDWQELRLDLQESLLDDLDREAKIPPQPPTQTATRDYLHTDNDNQEDHYFFVRIVLDHQNNALTVIGIKHHPRQK